MSGAEREPGPAAAGRMEPGDRVEEDLVVGLHRCLLEELHRRGHPPDRPLKVSELYRELVPYRLVRSRLSVALNADYEHAMLRLLAGEGGRVRIEPEEARIELVREAAEPYPFVGLFRKFAGHQVRVRLPPGSAAPAAPERQPAKATPEGATLNAPALFSGDTPVEPPAAPVRLHREPEEPVPNSPSDSSRATSITPPEPVSSDGTGECAFCASTLPRGRRVRYCPLCGADQRLRPCPRCDTVLEPEWRFCIHCGHDTGRA